MSCSKRAGKIRASVPLLQHLVRGSFQANGRSSGSAGSWRPMSGCQSRQGLPEPCAQVLCVACANVVCHMHKCCVTCHSWTTRSPA
eukprot:scaffold115454_cov17-Tisochrysis_lutea.AAC.2